MSASSPRSCRRWRCITRTVTPHGSTTIEIRAARLIAEAQSSRFAWERLALLGDTFGHRLSGSEALENAIRWAVAEMKKDGLDNVRAEPVKVPHWVRGQESIEITAPHPIGLVMLGLGNSVGTPAEGIEAEVLVVRVVRRARCRGRERARQDRSLQRSVHHLRRNRAVSQPGPSRAAALGAVAMLVRAVGPPGLRTPHTGALRYTEGVPQIPAAAIAVEDAERLQRMQNRGTKVRFRLKMEAKFLPDADSANVIGEIRGRERPG